MRLSSYVLGPVRGNELWRFRFNPAMIYDCHLKNDVVNDNILIVCVMSLQSNVDLK